MSLYDIDYTVAAGQELYPTNKRLPIMLKKEYALLSGINFIQKLHGYLMDGTEEDNYDAGTSYSFGELVIFQRKVYFRNQITNGYSIGVDPSTIYWTLVLNDFIGASEKVYFGPGKLVLEYALNRIFQTIFRQPVGVSPALSDIYIQNNETNQAQFYIGENDTESSYIAITDTDSTDYITVADLDPATTNFTIFVPIAVLTALNPTIAKAKAIVYSAALKYRLSGYTFIVQSY